jgi:phosphoglycerol transferase MdoB-like AlkP superfamily enzyme
MISYVARGPQTLLSFVGSRLASVQRHARGAGLVALLGFAGSIAVIERDIKTLPFLAASFAALVALSFLISRRPAFSLLMAAGIIALTTLGSIAKFKWMTINAHVFDIWFYATRPETFLFLAGSFPRLLLVSLVISAAACLCLAKVYRTETRAATGHRQAFALVLASGLSLPLTLPRDASDFNYHIADNHFASSFFASFSDLSRIAEPNPFTISTRNAEPFPASEACPAPGRSPDIVLTLSESAVLPAQIPGWSFDAALSERFKSFDGSTRKARVETYAGGTWISYASVIAGVSMADFGWKRPYATMLLREGLHHSLAATLARCGYRTVALSPGWFRFVNEGPFLKSMGFQEYYDAKSLGAPSAQEMDAFYYGKALDIYKQHIATDGRPLLLFVMSTVAHSPYTFRAGGDRRVAGDPFGNDAASDEYLRRLTLAQDDYADYLDKIRALRRPAIAAQFGDHHPVVTRAAFERAGQPQDPADWSSPLYETFYAITPINMRAQAALPDVPALDLAYLGITLLDVAGFPLDAVSADKRLLRSRCNGAFHTCADRAAVDRHLARMRRSGLLGALPQHDIRLGAIELK